MTCKLTLSHLINNRCKLFLQGRWLQDWKFTAQQPQQGPGCSLPFCSATCNMSALSPSQPQDGSRCHIQTHPHPRRGWLCSCKVSLLWRKSPHKLSDGSLPLRPHWPHRGHVYRNKAITGRMNRIKVVCKTNHDLCPRHCELHLSQAERKVNHGIKLKSS